MFCTRGSGQNEQTEKLLPVTVLHSKHRMTQTRRETNKRELLIRFLSLCLYLFSVLSAPVIQCVGFKVISFSFWWVAKWPSLLNRIDSLLRFSYQRHTLESDILALGFSLTNRDGNVMTSYHYIYVTLWSPFKKHKLFRSFCTWGVRTQMFLRYFCVSHVSEFNQSLTGTWPNFFVHTLYFSNEKTSTNYIKLCFSTFWEQPTLLECRQHHTYKFKPAWKASWSLASSDLIDF